MLMLLCANFTYKWHEIIAELTQNEFSSLKGKSIIKFRDLCNTVLTQY